MTVGTRYDHFLLSPC